MTSGHDECPACGWLRCPATRGEPRPEGCLATLPVAVICGSRDQFLEYCREHKLEPGRQAVQLRRLSDVRGAHFSAVDKYGTWWNTERSFDLERAAERRVRT